jgi:plasmid maintenance system antidote protein VapI
MNSISLVMEEAKNTFGRANLAEKIGVNPNQINSVIKGTAALPFSAALKLAELIGADPVTILCANAALKETNTARKQYLESKILPLEISRIICIMSTIILIKTSTEAKPTTVLLKL